jgi:lipoprotein-anchoring transpeptidase ErfK/SrfK
MRRSWFLVCLLAGAAAPRQTVDSNVLRLQAQLDRARFSPGEIDGREGSNTARARAAYERQHPDDEPAAVEPILSYVLGPADVEGPFEALPADMMDKARLPRLGYGSPLEAIAEKFHCSPDLLERLNPGAAWDRAGVTVSVPNVASADAAVPAEPAARVVVETDGLAVWALDVDGRPLARYPASIGSEHDPLPLGSYKVTAVLRNPKFFYNPDLFWDADPTHAKATLAPGPNNPVGVVWIGLSLEHYGIHGTPEPSAVGKTQSHGCIRLTNWDATDLADRVHPGIPVDLVQTPTW